MGEEVDRGYVSTYSSGYLSLANKSSFRESDGGIESMDMVPEAKKLYLEKCESVIQLPEGSLTGETRKRFRENPSRAAMVEIAGRDSVAAAIKAVREGSFTDLLPTYVFTGTERGSLKTVEDAVHRLSVRLPDTRIHGLVILGSSRFWQALNGRFISELITRFGFYSPCMGCHLYLHSVRIPLAALLGGVAIISGERESHDGQMKVNQTAEALERYQAFCSMFGISLVLPLRKVVTGEEVEHILGFRWEEGKEQLGCVLSGNYRMLHGGIGPTPGQVARCLDEFIVPCAQQIISAYLAERVPESIEIAAKVLTQMKG